MAKQSTARFYSIEITVTDANGVSQGSGAYALPVFGLA
jgi:hypothetical protein